MTFDDNFLDWYERWLDEIISGKLIENGGSNFDAIMSAGETKLFEKLQNAGSDNELVVEKDKKYLIFDLMMTVSKSDYDYTDELSPLCFDEEAKVREYSCYFLRQLDNKSSSGTSNKMGTKEQ